MNKLIATLAAVGAVSLSAIVSESVVAASPRPGYVGQTSSSVAGCPNIQWRLAKADDGKITGIVYYADMSGVSAAEGMAEGGKFHITTTSTMGNGPVSTIDGTRTPQGNATATMVGAGCANATFTAISQVDINAIAWSAPGG
jgi:hypothetical protein